MMITEATAIISSELIAVESYHRLYLNVAVVLFACCVSVFLYHLFYPDVRPRLMTTAATITLSGAVVVACITLFAGTIETSPPRLQTFASSLRTLALLVVLIYICRIAGRNQGSKNRVLGPLCRSAPTVLLGAWTLQVVFGQIHPTTLVGDTPNDFAHFWLMKVFNVLWIGYFAAAGAIFAKDALRRQAINSWKLRIQQLALAVACACGSFIVVIGMIAAFVLASADTPIPINSSPQYDAAQFYAVMIMGSMLVVGFFVYHSNRETEHTVKQLRNWIRKRHELELLFRREFGGEVGPPETILTFRASILATPSLLSSEFAARGASNLIKLLRVLHNIDKMTTIQIKHLSSLQNSIFAQPELTYSAVERSGAYVKYDLANDPLFAAIRPAMLLRQPRAKLDLTNEEDWVQIGALAAADAGYLPATNASKLLDPGCSAVQLGLLENHRLAKDTAPTMRLSEDLSLEKIPDYRK